MSVGIVEALKIDPGDDLAWLALADWLEEAGQAEAAELHRLGLALRRSSVEPRVPIEARLRQRLAAGVRPVVPCEIIKLGADVELKMALIPPGVFHMGSPSREPQRDPNEGLPRRVTLTRGFYLGAFAVTQTQWRRVLGDSPSRCRFHGDDRPMEGVSWNDAKAFCARLSGRRGRFRLPTEAEWEYSCRAGTTTPFHFGDTLSTKQANYDGCFAYGRGRKGTYRQHTMSVGSFAANAFGLFDMHGNVNEWCQDAYESNDQRSGPEEDPCRYGESGLRVVRGGAWYNGPAQCRSASRTGAMSQRGVGLRVVRELA